MKKENEWILCEVKWFVIKVLHVLTGKYYTNSERYGNNELLTREIGNCYILKGISKGDPFAYCRFGFVEMDIMIRCQRDKLLGTHSLNRREKTVRLFNIQGTSEKTGVYKFNTIMNEACQEADVLGVWNNLAMGDALINTLIKDRNKKIVDAVSVEPYIFDIPWSYALRGKRVLVVSPFSETIKLQYKNNREKLFKNKKVLPEFELVTVDSVWYSSEDKDERFENWFDAYEFLYNRIMSEDFDIALLGCGPFGFPLAARIKRAGMQAIHMGGAVQLLFGIKGKRWDDTIGRWLYNDYWVRAPISTMPGHAEILDGSCYW